jgi:hypothetical protein
MVVIRLLNPGTADLHLANQGHGHPVSLVCLPSSKIAVDEMELEPLCHHSSRRSLNPPQDPMFARA